MRRRSSRPSLAVPWLSSWWILLVLGATIAVFYQVRSFEFVSWDDPWYVSQNPHVTGGLSASSLWWALTTGDGYYWHPLTWISHLVDVTCFGLDAGLHHLQSLGLHLLNTLLLFLWLRRSTGAVGRSLFVAALFALHPVHVESVAWVAERKDVLSTCFLMVTLLAYQRYTSAPNRGRAVLVAVAYALGLMSKPMLVTLPVLLLLVDVWPGRRWPEKPFSALVVEKLPLFGLALASTIITVINQAHAGAVRPLSTFPLEMRAANALASLAAYLRMAVWPTGLSAFYPYPVVLPWVGAAIGFALLVGGGVVAWRLRVSRPYVPFGVAWFVVSLLPVIGLVQAGDQAMADRFTYVAYVGLFVAAAWSAADAGGTTRVRQACLATAAIVVAATLAVVAERQAGYWHDSERLWKHAAEVTEGNEYAHANLGHLYETQTRLPDAAREYQAAAEVAEASPQMSPGRNPGAARLRNQAGIALMRANQPADALSEFDQAVKAKTDDLDAIHNRAIALERLGRMDEAVLAYREALRVSPSDAGSLANLALLLAQRGELGEAIPLCQQALQLDYTQPDWHYNLGVMLEQSGKVADAVAQYQATLQLEPGHAGAQQALLALGVPHMPAPR